MRGSGAPISAVVDFSPCNGALAKVCLRSIVKYSVITRHESGFGRFFFHEFCLGLVFRGFRVPVQEPRRVTHPKGP